MRWKLTKTLVASFACLSLVNCAALETIATGDEGRIHITADAEGMKAWSDMLAAQAQISKDSPDKKGASWQLREAETSVKAIKFQYRKKAEQ
jgi:hypothetical protein